MSVDYEPLVKDLDEYAQAKESKTRLNSRITAVEAPFDTLESGMNRAEVELRIAESGFLNLLTKRALSS